MARRRVLVVDDDDLTLDILRTILDLEEFEVVTAADGTEALTALGEHEFDVVVLDVMMPGLDGYAVCERIKGDPETAQLPVVLLTAKDRREDVEEGERVGADAYLTKPFSPLSLIETLNRVGVRGAPTS